LPATCFIRSGIPAFSFLQETGSDDELEQDSFGVGGGGYHELHEGDPPSPRLSAFAGAMADKMAERSPGRSPPYHETNSTLKKNSGETVEPNLAEIT